MAIEKALGIEKIIISEKKSIEEVGVTFTIEHDDFAKLDSITNAQKLIENVLKQNYPNIILKLSKIIKPSKIISLSRNLTLINTKGASRKLFSATKKKIYSAPVCNFFFRNFFSVIFLKS